LIKSNAGKINKVKQNNNKVKNVCAKTPLFFEAFMTVRKAPTAFVLPEERVPLHHFYSKRV
jgi:hypothetical protein